MRYSIPILVLVTVFMASVALGSGEDKDHVCFRVLDTDKDGLVTYEEFQKVYGDDKDKYDTADLDKDGKLTHDEYHDLLGHGGEEG